MPATLLVTFWVAASPALGVPSSDAIVSHRADGRIEVRAPGASARTLMGPTGCALVAVAPDAVICRTPEGKPLTIDLATGAVAPLRVEPLSASTTDYERLEIRAAGRRWIEGEIWLSSDTSPSSLIVPVIVDRSTGAVRVLRRFGSAAQPSGWDDPRRYLDLDSPSPMRKLCRPVRRSLFPQPTPELGRLVKVGRWTLREITSEASAGRARYRVQGCGSSRTTAVPPNSEPVLGRHHVAWFDRRWIRLRNLTTGRVRTFVWKRPHVWRDHMRIRLTSNRLVVSTRHPDGSGYDIATVPLR